MIEMAFLSLALWLGVDVRRLAVLATATLVPIACALALGIVWWTQRTADAPKAARFCEAVAAELRSGASLRQSISAAARAVGSTSLAAVTERGDDLTAIGAAAYDEFPEIGIELKTCMARSSALGAPVAELFDEIGSLALAQLDVAREVNSAMAPARATVLLLMAAPVVALWWAARSGDLAKYLAFPGQRLAIVLGGGLSLGAVIVGTLMLRRPA